MGRSRLLLVLQDVVLAAATSVRLVREDPIHFAVQVARRVLPRRWRGVRPKGTRPTIWRAFRWFLMDQTPAALEDLRVVGVHGRLGAELAATLGFAEPSELDPLPGARAWLARGELSQALKTAPRASALRERVTSELQVYSVGMGLPVAPKVGTTRRAQSRRVLFVLTNSLPYTQSGYTLRTHAILSELVRQGVEVRAVTRIGYPVTVGLLGKPECQLIDGVAYQRLPSWRLPVRLDTRLAAQVRALGRIVEEFGPDVLHTTTDLTNAVVTRTVAESYGLPWVYELRGQLELSWVASRPAKLQPAAQASQRVRLWRARDTELAQSADRVVVLSEVQRDDMITRGVDRGKIMVVPNCVDDAVLERPTISAADARNRLGLPREGSWVGSVTSVVDYEGLDILLEAVALARSQGSDLRVAIVGDGVSRPGLITRARELGLGPGIAVLPGRVPPDEALGWYEALDVFVVPRRDTPVARVVTPLKPLTALALKRPIVVSDLPALRQLRDRAPGLVSTFVTGSVEELATTLCRTSSPENGLSAASLSWATAVAALRDAYASLARGS